MRFVIPGEPKPKQRPRVGKNGNVYTPPGTRDYEEYIAWLAKATGKKFEADTPLILQVDFHCGAKGPQRADVDNLLKALLDGIEKSGAIGNDKEIICIEAYRWDGDENPRTEVSLSYAPYRK